DIGFLAWRPDGHQIASAGKHGTLRVWETKSGQPKWLAVLVNAGRAAAFSPTGELLWNDANAEQDLVYVHEKLDGAVELLTPTEFRKRVEAGAARSSD